ncbi:hypothetical protein [Bacillus sp. FJAT-45066]|uniref:hypothetical protein n=1 Tax=Bacillus sp. FJAT-45066 TaxID=2011010 RepID=UPI000BB7B0C7|nr:hypothetical protein [Bacillus sp. FJAT-45066]
METAILYYKIYNNQVVAADYIQWALHQLEQDQSSTSLNVLASLQEPLNIFEVEDYFHKAIKELNIEKPTIYTAVQQYMNLLLEKIIQKEASIIDLAYDIYKITWEKSDDEKLEAAWYEISEQINDYRHGDNINNLTEEELNNLITKEANHWLEKSKGTSQ